MVHQTPLGAPTAPHPHLSQTDTSTGNTLGLGSLVGDYDSSYSGNLSMSLNSNFNLAMVRAATVNVWGKS